MSDDTSSSQAEWWRRVSFILIGVMTAMLGYWLVTLDERVASNRADIDGILRSVDRLTGAVESNTAAQNRNYEKLSELATAIDALERAEEAGR